MRELTEDELRVRCEELEKEIAQMRAERPTTLTAEAPPLNSVKLIINAKQQLTGEVKVYGNDMMAAYIEAFKIISIIKAKNEKIE